MLNNALWPRKKEVSIHRCQNLWIKRCPSHLCPFPPPPQEQPTIAAIFICLATELWCTFPKECSLLFEAIVGWTGPILTGPGVPECCPVLLCVILSPNWGLFEVKAFHGRVKERLLWSAVSRFYLWPLFSIVQSSWQDNLLLSQGENESHDWSCWGRNRNVCKVIGGNVRACFFRSTQFSRENIILQYFCLPIEGGELYTLGL